MDQAALDPHALIRRFHAAHNILQNPLDPRDWLHLPSDVMHHVLDSLAADAQQNASKSSSSNLANLRLTCRVWNGCVNRHMDKMRLGLWPARPDFLGQFTSLSELALSAGSIADPEERVATVRPLLDTLGRLPKLQRLALTYAGPGSIDNLDQLQGLTHLALSNPCVHSRRPAPSTAAAAADAAAAGVDADLAAAFGHQHHQQQQQQPLLPGAVGDGADGMQQQQEQGANSNSSSEDGSHSSHSSSGSTGSPKDAAVLPESVGRLGQLQQLLLVDMTPEFSVLSQLTALDRLEVRGQTMRLAGSHVLACNPLPGVGVLRGLTHLVARSNYGINRLPGDLGSLSLLQHLDVSKNMLWVLPVELTLLTSLEHLDVSSNCLSTIPDSISLLAGRLTFLDISNNSRVQLPGTLGALHKLVQLNISWIWSDLGVLWEGATGLSSLQVLNVVGNGVSQLPPTVGSFKSLTHLALSMNNLTSLPDSIGCLTTLQHLEVSDNRLQDLPGTLGRLVGLHSLGLRSNCLCRLPGEVGRLSWLTYLDASMNNIASLPDSLTGLTNLNQLALSMNPLGVLPAGLTALQKLRILEMYYVKLEERGDQQPAGSCKALQDAIPGLYVFSNTLSADQYGAELAELAAAEAAAADPDSDEGDGQQPQAAAAIAATAAAAGQAGFDAADMEGLVEAAAVEQQQVGVGRSANADLEQQQQQQQQAGSSRAARAAAGLTVDVTHLDPVTLPGGLVIDLNTLEVTRRTEESEGAPTSSAAAAGSSSFGGQQQQQQQQQQQAGLCSLVPAAAAARCDEGEDLTLLLSPVGMSAGSFCSSGLPSPLQPGALFSSPTGSDSSGGGSSSNGRRLSGVQLLRSSCGSSVASETPDCELTSLVQPSATASLAGAGVCCVAQQHLDQGCSDTAAAADTTAAAAAAAGAGSNNALLQSFGSNLSISSISSSNADQKVVSWYDASVRSRRSSTLSSASCPCLASAAAAAGAAAAATEPSAAAVAAMSAVAAAGSNAGGGISSRSAVGRGANGAGGTNVLPLPGSWSFDVSMLAAARLASHSVGESEGTDGVAPLPLLPRSRSVGRSLLSRYSRGGEASNSPTGLGFQSIQQQQQQQRAAAAGVDLGRQPAATDGGGSGADTAAAAASGDGRRAWLQLGGRRATAFVDE